MKIPFSPPDISELEINEVIEALKSGWITTGPRTKKLEKLIAEYVGVKQCVCLNSQTACAEMALRVLGVGVGDEVIVPAYTYTASASVICHVGATPVMVDCAKDGFEMDYEQLENAITAKTKAIIPVDLGGVPCDYKKIFEIVECKKDIFNPTSKIQKALGRIAVMADTAHSFGACKNGVMAGNIADFSSFSFHAVKNLTTAEGGALTWKSIDGVSDDEIYKQLQLLSLHGQNKDALAKTQIGAWEYDIIGPWYKCNMTDIMAAIGLRQLDRYKGLLRRRVEIIGRYDAVCDELGISHMKHHTEIMDSSNHLYLIRIPEIKAEDRNDIITKLAERGVPTNVHYKPLPMMTAYGSDCSEYPNAYDYYHNLITLPLHTRLSYEDIDFIIDNLKEVVSDYL